MEIFSDVLFLSRLQFTICVAFHFLFVPTSIGTGLIMALAGTRYYRSRDPKDASALKFWVKIFTLSFAVGLASGITMEFSFGTNWADYSRFVGDIFGAPLAAEALLAFFLESTFLGIVIFGRNKVSPRFYMISGWLVFFGACLSALWILIANSWMQTPAGYEVVTTATGATQAVLTDFFAAALNPSTGPRYFHTLVAILIFGAFVAIAIGAYHMLKGKNDFGKYTVRVGTIVGIITLILMLPAAHQQAVQVADTQPTKFAAMEGHWESGPVGLSLLGVVDEETKSTMALELPLSGATSWLASGSFDTEYPGLNDYPEELHPPVNFTFQAYHLMVALYIVMIIWWILALIASRKNATPSKGLLRVLLFAPLFPMLAIQSGWFLTEIGRQPWIVYGELLTEDAVSQAVTSTDLLITIALFVVVYLFILIAFLRMVLKAIKNGPEDEPQEAEALSANAQEVR